MGAEDGPMEGKPAMQRAEDCQNDQIEKANVEEHLIAGIPGTPGMAPNGAKTGQIEGIINGTEPNGHPGFGQKMKPLFQWDHPINCSPSTNGITAIVQPFPFCVAQQE
jgi:hypothetical protein